MMRAAALLALLLSCAQAEPLDPNAFPPDEQTNDACTPDAASDGGPCDGGTADGGFEP